MVWLFDAGGAPELERPVLDVVGELVAVGEGVCVFAGPRLARLFVCFELGEAGGEPVEAVPVVAT